jgi:ribosomal protein L11 methyltransferase
VELRDTGTLLSASEGRCLVVTYVVPEAREQVLEAAHDAMERARAGGVAVDPVTVRERLADETEWRDVWKQFFRATRIGRRFTVRPSWDPGETPPGEFVIDLDPGRAFGTGAHASTRLVVALTEDVCEHATQVERILDLGCGSGILTIAAARLWPAAHVVAVDNDPEATDCAQENFERNGLVGVEVVTGVLSSVAPGFQLIMANIQADVLIDLAASLVAALSPGGHLILSGILTEQGDSVVQAFAQAGLRLHARREEGEWVGLTLVDADVAR